MRFGRTRSRENIGLEKHSLYLLGAPSAAKIYVVFSTSLFPLLLERGDKTRDKLKHPCVQTCVALYVRQSSEKQKPSPVKLKQGYAKQLC